MSKIVRYIKLKIYNDNMKAYMSIGYEVIGNQDNREQMINNAPYIEDKEIKDIINGFGIKNGLIKDRFNKFTKVKYSDEMLIASGRKSMDDLDDQIEFVYEFDDNKLLYNLMKLDRYYDFSILREIDSNELIARIIVGKKGRNGSDIYGNKLLKKEKKSYLEKFSNDCNIIGDKIFTVFKGVPQLIQDKVYILKVFKINGDILREDIDIKDNIRILGNISKKIVVKSRGKIEVLGKVQEASIVGAMGVNIKSDIFGSEIFTGNLSEYSKDKIKIINKIVNKFSSMCLTLESLDENTDFNSQLIKSYGEIYSIVRDVFGDFDLKELTTNQLRAYKLMENLFLDGNIQKIESLEEIKFINEFILLNFYKLSQEFNVKGNIYINKAVNTKISSSNDVYILGDLCENTNILSDNNVIFLNSDNDFNGGTIIARKNVFCKNVGSKKADNTKIQVGIDGKIYCEKVYRGCILAVNDYEYEAKEDLYKIVIYLEDNRICIDKYEEVGYL